VKILTNVSRFLLGVIFLVFGLNGFLHFIPMPPPSGIAGHGLTQAQIDKLTPQRAHEILATPAASVAPPAAPPIVGDEKGVGRL